MSKAKRWWQACWSCGVSIIVEQGPDMQGLVPDPDQWENFCVCPVCDSTLDPFNGDDVVEDNDTPGARKHRAVES